MDLPDSLLGSGNEKLGENIAIEWPETLLASLNRR
jgi:hypothetical protein